MMDGTVNLKLICKYFMNSDSTGRHKTQSQPSGLRGITTRDVAHFSSHALAEVTSQKPHMQTTSGSTLTQKEPLTADSSTPRYFFPASKLLLQDKLQ
jgi:hypothetical protein